MAINIPGVDVHSGLDLCDGDLVMYLRFLRLYVTNIPATLEKIRNLSEETLKDYIISVHGVKSNSEMIGAEEARKTAQKLEALAKGGDLAGVLAQNKAFIKYVENLVDNIRSWLEKNNAPA